MLVAVCLVDVAVGAAVAVLLHLVVNRLPRRIHVVAAPVRVCCNDETDAVQHPHHAHPLRRYVAHPPHRILVVTHVDGNPFEMQ